VQHSPGDDDTLFVSFDGEALENALRQAGQTVWGSERPLTLIWLAVDWGRGEREIISAEDPQRSRDEARSIDRNRLLRQRVLDIAERRGLPVAFPLLDTVDLKNISFSDIWGEFGPRRVSAIAGVSISVARNAAGLANRNWLSDSWRMRCRPSSPLAAVPQ
jgi:hypothetical protein